MLGFPSIFVIAIRWVLVLATVMMPRPRPDRIVPPTAATLNENRRAERLTRRNDNVLVPRQRSKDKPEAVVMDVQLEALLRVVPSQNGNRASEENQDDEVAEQHAAVVQHEA